MSVKSALVAFNRGLISSLGLSRVDISRIALSAETMSNWMPRVLGSMALRPGLEYITSTLSNNAAKYLPFVFSTTDTALLELTDSNMRVIIDDVVLTRPSVSAAVTNGTFTTDLTGWTDSDEGGAVSTWATGGYLQMVGTGTSAAIRDQQVTTVDAGTEHALRVVIPSGPVTFSVGSTQGGEEYVTATTLDEGEHSLSFTPNGSFWIRLLSRRVPIVLVDSCTIEAAGEVVIPTPWVESELSNIRNDQSGDILYVAAGSSIQQRVIERRATRSWSVAKYFSDDGPFNVENLTTTTIATSAIIGNVTLTASDPLFRELDVGRLYAITSVGQIVTATISAQNTFTNTIRVTGVGASRAFTVDISGLVDSTVTLQQSVDSASGPWVDTNTYVVDTVDNANDGLSNQIVYYRIGIKTGDYGTDTVTTTLNYPSGSIRGITRITDYTSSIVVGAEVLTALGGTTASEIWEEGRWSDTSGWPSSVAFHEGRLWWAGLNGIWGSISDSYYSFDPTFVGDAGVIDRSIGAGPVDTVNWIVSLESLLLGTQGSEFVGRSSILGDILTPSTFSLKQSTNQGSGGVEAIKVDDSCMFVNRSGIRIYEETPDSSGYNYTATDATALVPELGKPAIVRMTSHRQPDTRLHCVRSDGVAMVSVSDRNENVLAWVTVVTDGSIEDVVTLPATSGNADDQVYYVVNRTINGVTVRYLEKWAQESECRGGTLNKQADAFLSYTGIETTTITGLDHLEGESVVVWADGADVGTDDSSSTWAQTHTVSSGQISLTTPATNVVVGLPYTAQFKSTKLGDATQFTGTPLNQEKRIRSVGVIAENFHKKGIRFGPTFDDLDDMPEVEEGATVTEEVRTTYDAHPIEFDGVWTSDARLCIQADAPRPVTLLSMMFDLDMP